MPEKGWTTLTVREHVGIRINKILKKKKIYRVRGSAQSGSGQLGLVKTGR